MIKQEELVLEKAYAVKRAWSHGLPSMGEDKTLLALREAIFDLPHVRPVTLTKVTPKHGETSIPGLNMSCVWDWMAEECSMESICAHQRSRHGVKASDKEIEAEIVRLRSTK